MLRDKRGILNAEAYCLLSSRSLLLLIICSHLPYPSKFGILPLDVLCNSSWACTLPTFLAILSDSYRLSSVGKE